MAPWTFSSAAPVVVSRVKALGAIAIFDDMTVDRVYGY
jgi:hypothetical protein